jgi:hypothetical protein
VLRAGNQDIRRPPGPLFDATLVSALADHPDRPRDRRPRLESRLARMGYLLAACLELAGARLAADLDTLPRLPAALTSVC